MRAYRSIDIKELYRIFKSGTVAPHKFNGSCDSDASAGSFLSFWFPSDKPVRMSRAFYVVVEADVCPDYAGRMRFHQDDGYNTFTYFVNEVATDKSVCPKRLFIDRSMIDWVEQDYWDMCLTLDLDETNGVDWVYGGQGDDEMAAFYDWMRQNEYDIESIQTIHSIAEMAEWRQND